MFFTNKRKFKFPSVFEIDKNLVEVDQDLRLQGFVIANKLSFKKHVKNIKCLVNCKLFSIKNDFLSIKECKASIFSNIYSSSF